VGTAQAAANDAPLQQTAANAAFTAGTAAANAAATSAGAGATGAQGYAAAATTQAGNAQTANTNGTTAAATSTTELTNVQTNADSVAAQSIIAQYSNPTIANTGVNANRFGGTFHAPNFIAAGNVEKVQGSSDTQPNTTYVLDGNKNLVEIRDTSYASAPGVAPTISYTDASVKFAGGTAFDNNVLFDPANPNYMALGRWQGGTIEADDQANGAGVDHTVNLGPRSAHWGIAFAPASGYVQSLTGTSTYTRLANTSPTDASGNVGTLNTATLSANFAAQTVTAGVNLTVASKTIDATATGLPITGTGFSGSFGTVNCAPACTYAGRLDGTFAGQNAAAAAFGYDLWAGNNPYTDLIQGVVAFSTGTPPPLAPKPDANIATAYFYAAGGGSSATSFQASGTTYTLDGSGHLTQVAEDPLQEPFDQQESQTITGGTSPTKSSVTSTSASATVVDFGRWQGGSVSGVNFNGAFGPDTVQGAYHWIKGPAIGPFYLPMALTGTVSYNGTTPAGMVTDQAGTAGTIDTASTFSVNFTQQSVAFDIRANTAAGAWRGLGAGVGLEGGGQFFASSGATSPHQNMSVEFNSSTTGTFGNVDGTLMGNGADAAGVAFTFGQGANRAAGTVAFTSGTAQSASTSYVAGIVAAGKLGSPVTALQAPILTTTLAALDPDLAFAVEGTINASSRVTRDGASQVTRFDAELPVAQPTGCTSTCTDVSFTPGTYTLRDNTYPLDPPPTPGGVTSATALTDTGADATTGLRWGRYVGFVSYGDRITGTASNPAVSAAAFDARTSNWHGIWADAQTAAPVLPASGTVNYTLLGGTRPSDSAGNVAATPATATLSANFTAMTVNASVNTTVGANAWAASANNIPIAKGTYFEAQKSGAGGNLSVTMNGSAAGTAGRMMGIFTGNATGATGGAMLGYSLNQGGAAGVTMQGVSAFKKP
jgi:hypothetical protein